jgi:hypothetical protein
MDREHPGVTFARYVDDVVVHAVTLRQAERLRSVIAERMAEVGVPRTLEAGLCRWVQVKAVLCG